MSQGKDALILTQNLVHGLEEHVRSSLENAIFPSVEMKIDWLKQLNISNIFVSVGSVSFEFEKKVEGLGAKIIEVNDYETGLLGSFSGLVDYVERDMLVMRASRLYPRDIMKILASSELNGDILIAVDTDGNELKDSIEVVFSDELVRPSVKEFDEGIENPDGFEMGIYLSSPISFHEAVVLLNEEKYDISDLIRRMDSRVLPFNDVNILEIDSSK